eukprot:gene38440-46719_t
MKGPLAGLFDEHHYLYDVSGAGNNFAQGYYQYGPQYREKIIEGLRHNAEKCESLQTYLVTHSLGGGTGSGVGSYLLGILSDEYPKVARFAMSVFPSGDSDVITSPYNTVLATQQLLEHCDCVFPVRNQALYSFYQTEHGPAKAEEENQPKSSSKRSRGFDEVNLIAARMLCHLTASSRFHGEMNVDMNEIYTNLVPFPRMHFLLASMSLRSPKRAAALGGRQQDVSHSAIQRAFGDLIGPKGGHLTGLTPSAQQAVTLASAFISRGRMPLTEFTHGVQHVQRQLRYTHWNPEACKIGMCGVAGPGETMAVMAVYNSSIFKEMLQGEMENFYRLYRAKAMLHHYTAFTSEDAIKAAEHGVSELVADYEALEAGTFPRRPEGANNDVPSRLLGSAF